MHNPNNKAYKLDELAQYLSDNDDLNNNFNREDNSEDIARSYIAEQYNDYKGAIDFN